MPTRGAREESYCATQLGIRTCLSALEAAGSHPRPRTPIRQSARLFDVWLGQWVGVLRFGFELRRLIRRQSRDERSRNASRHQTAQWSWPRLTATWICRSRIIRVNQRVSYEDAGRFGLPVAGVSRRGTVRAVRNTLLHHLMDCDAEMDGYAGRGDWHRIVAGSVET